MNEEHHISLTHWQQIDCLVQEWLRERQQLLSLLHKMNRPVGVAVEHESAGKSIQRFCEILIDYISAGYFEVYRELACEARYLDNHQARMASSIIRQLEDSTDEALAFNEDFDTQAHIHQKQDILPHRLSRLMEKLEERFALEDQLIVSIHQSSTPEHAVLH